MEVVAEIYTVLDVSVNVFVTRRKTYLNKELPIKISSRLIFKFTVNLSEPSNILVLPPTFILPQAPLLS